MVDTVLIKYRTVDQKEVTDAEDKIKQWKQIVHEKVQKVKEDASFMNVALKFLFSQNPLTIHFLEMRFKCVRLLYSYSEVFLM